MQKHGCMTHMVYWFGFSYTRNPNSVKSQDSVHNHLEWNAPIWKSDLRMEDVSHNIVVSCLINAVWNYFTPILQECIASRVLIRETICRILALFLVDLVWKDLTFRCCLGSGSSRCNLYHSPPTLVMPLDHLSFYFPERKYTQRGSSDYTPATILCLQNDRLTTQRPCTWVTNW